MKDTCRKAESMICQSKEQDLKKISNLSYQNAFLNIICIKGEEENVKTLYICKSETSQKRGKINVFNL